MFADTDFLFALVKPSDWLKDNAFFILKKHKGQIKTSISCIIELAILCKRFKFNTAEIFSNLFELINVEEKDYKLALSASIYMEKYSLTVFDAFHAAYCNKDIMISSDSVYDKVNIKRIDLRKT